MPAAGGGLVGRMRSQFAELESRLESVLTKKRRQRFFASCGPSLLVVTFAEDGMRIFFRWSEQINYMTNRMGMGRISAAIFLLLSAAVQLGGFAFIVRPAHFKPSRVKPASYALLTFVAMQPFLYGQATDMDFMCRSITLAGGFLLLIWSENERERRSEGMGLPMGDNTPGADRLQLFGRALLTFIFLFQAIAGENGGLHSVLTRPSLWNITSSCFLLCLSCMVCVGFKTEWSAIALTTVLGVSNVWMYPFWAVHSRLVDFYKYYFFQTLSVMGGLMLLALHGPGGISLEGAKKSL